MTATDDRLREMETGLGIVSNQVQRFYPRRFLTATINEEFDGRTLTICLSPDGIPLARWSDATQPIQFLARWYGFSHHFPGCEVYDPANATTTSPLSGNRAKQVS